MRFAERIAGLVGGFGILLVLIGLAVYRGWATGVEVAALPVTATHVPTGTPIVALTISELPTVVPEPSATYVPTTTPEPTQTPIVEATSGPVVHVVQRGENLYRIALSYGVPLQSLALSNQIVDTSQLYVGQQLLIPLSSSVSLVAPQPPNVAAVVTPMVDRGSAAPSQTINGIPIQSFIRLNGPTRQTIRLIYARGQALGNNAHAFSSVGDSTIEYPYFMTRFDQPGSYNLGIFGYLQPTIDFFAGSFNRESQGVMRGLRASTALDPFWSNKNFCYTNESRVACEYRLQRPSFVFIRLGSNDTQPAVFDQYLRQVVDFWIEKGVVPILGTKADRHEGPDNADNNVIRKIASDYNLPLWDFDALAQTIPGGGVGRDGVHLTSFYSHDFTAPEALQRGYGVHNLTGLMALDEVWRALVPEPGDRR
jgi:LysM repeat protein